MLREETAAAYTYDGEHRPIRVRTVRTVYNPACPEEFETAVGVETYSYTATGELVRKEAYVEDEELKTGINIEEHVFNDKGVEVQSFSYNSLDPSSKCYTENEVDENGKTLAAFDESGEHTDAETLVATMKNGIVARTVKDLNGNVKIAACGDGNVNNTYDNEQKLTRSVDSISGETAFTYNAEGNVTSVSVHETETECYHYEDAVNKGLLTNKTVGGTTYEFTYKATADKALDSISVDGNTVRPNTDALGRNTGKAIEVGERKVAEEKISYVKFGDHATNLPSTVRFASNGVFKKSMQYRYDSMGNIIEIFENGRSTCRYEYDSLGRLTREDNVAFGKTTTWAYDNNGNILAKYEYAITTKPTSELHLLDCTYIPYSYADNSDQLMAYNGEEFVYDTISNPTIYRGKVATWAYGRQSILRGRSNIRPRRRSS